MLNFVKKIVTFCTNSFWSFREFLAKTFWKNEFLLQVFLLALVRKFIYLIFYSVLYIIKYFNIFEYLYLIFDEQNLNITTFSLLQKIPLRQTNFLSETYSETYNKSTNLLQLFGKSGRSSYIPVLLLIIKLCFTCGERKNWWNVKNIYTTVAGSEIAQTGNDLFSCFFGFVKSISVAWVKQAKFLASKCTSLLLCGKPVRRNYSYFSEVLN